MRLGAGREGGDLLMPYMHPLDLALAPQSIGQPVEAVSDDAVDPFDARRGKRFGELIGNGLHDLSLLKAMRSCATLANLMILNATIYCTVVTPDTLMVFSAAPWFTSTRSSPETLLSTLLRLRTRKNLAA
jgi:hypothetical protein